MGATGPLYVAETGKRSYILATIYLAETESGGVLLAPIADITTASWQSSLGGALYAAIDELVADDSDYIYSPNDPTTQEWEIKFQPAIDPLLSTGQIAHYRLWAVAKDTSFRITWMCGATQIAQWTESVLADTKATFAHTLAGAEADAITDYTDNRLRIRASA